jgi:hypothetical protein
MGRESFLGVKRPERGVDQQPSSRAEVKEREELSPFGLSWPVLGCTLLLPLQVKYEILSI